MLDSKWPTVSDSSSEMRGDDHLGMGHISHLDHVGLWPLSSFRVAAFIWGKAENVCGLV